MSSRAKRGIAAAVTVVMAAAGNVATGMLTQSWAAGWWAAAIVLVIVGTAAQVWLTVADHAGGGTGGIIRRGERAPGRSVTITGHVSGIVSAGDSATNTQIR